MAAGSLAERLASRIAAHGPIPVSEFVEAALYDDGSGFYAAGGRAGRSGDFLTAPEVGPLFGAVIAGAVDEWWRAAGGSDRYVVVEHGAGPGSLARAVLAAEPECLQTGALTWVAVERAAAQRDSHPTHPSVVPVGSDDDWPDADVVLANELLDNLPFDMVERTDVGWREVLVEAVPGGFAAMASGAVVDHPWLPDAPTGVRLPVEGEARAWVGAVRSAHPRARMVVLDYGAPTSDLVGRDGGWLRTHVAHGASGDWLVDPGSCDITVDVAVDQIQLDHPATTVESQAAFLCRHGIEALVEEGRSAWTAGAPVGDLAALRARSRIRESEALLDPDGMGAFVALEWVV